VERARPAPGEEFNDGAVTTARAASTVILLRGGADSLEVLLVQRTPHARFMGGAWVFPGGAVGSEDGAGQAGHRAAAVRELAEEAGITVPDPEALIPFARWITPAEVKIRFDTWFYLAPAPAGAEAQIDGAEVVDSRWCSPAQALSDGKAGELFLVFPTIKQLEQLARFDSADALLAHARGREVVPVLPKVVGSGEEARIVLPGEPGYGSGDRATQ
jgi:8-oxo-dGTP pyrophosphatase MutT (NUDIX family)